MRRTQGGVRKIQNFDQFEIDQFDDIDTIKKREILEKTAELMNKDNLPNPQDIRRIDRLILKGQTCE